MKKWLTDKICSCQLSCLSFYFVSFNLRLSMDVPDLNFLLSHQCSLRVCGSFACNCWIELEIGGKVGARASFIEKFHRLRFGYGASLAQNEAVESFSAGLEAHINRLESNRRVENVRKLCGREQSGSNFSSLNQSSLTAFILLRSHLLRKEMHTQLSELWDKNMHSMGAQAI